MVDDDLVNRWDGLFLEFSNDQRLDLTELPVMGKPQDGSPILRGGIVDGVYAVQDITDVSDMKSRNRVRGRK